MTHPNRTFVSVCLALALCLSSPPARAQHNAGETAALRQFEDGVKLYEAGQFERALVAFEGSMQLLSSPNTRLYAARCYRALGKTASAYTSYKRAAREAIDRQRATGEKRYAATRDAATAELAEIEPKVPRVTLAVPSNIPADFEVLLDGAALPAGAWGTALEVDPGPHEVVARAARHTGFRQQVTVTEGEQVRVQIELPPIPTAYVTLVFRSRPSGLALTVAGKPLDVPTNSPRPQEVDVGKLVVRADAPGYEPFVWSRSLANGERAQVVIDLHASTLPAGASRGTPPWLLYTGLAATGVGFAAGTYFGLSAQGDSDEQQALDPFLRTKEAQSAIERDALLADIGFVVGAAGAISSAILLFTTDWEKTSSRKSSGAVRPVVGPGFAGAVAGGSL